MIYNNQNAPRSLPNKPISQFVADIHIREAKPAQSKSNADNSQWILECEILGPETVEVDGEACQIVGSTFTKYLSLTPKSLRLPNGLFNLQAACGYQNHLNDQKPFEVLDLNGNPVEEPWKGKSLKVRMGSAKPFTPQEDVVLTKEQIMKGVSPKRDVIDPETGKPVVIYKIELKSVIGPSDAVPTVY